MNQYEKALAKKRRNRVLVPVIFKVVGMPGRGLRWGAIWRQLTTH
jgi:hypothetical protein